MAEREHKKREQENVDQREDVLADDLPTGSQSGEKLKSDMDDLLDEIDEVLETNAEDFVKSYIQKGGE